MGQIHCQKCIKNKILPFNVHLWKTENLQPVKKQTGVMDYVIFQNLCWEKKLDNMEYDVIWSVKKKTVTQAAPQTTHNSFNVQPLTAKPSHDSQPDHFSQCNRLSLVGTALRMEAGTLSLLLLLRVCIIRQITGLGGHLLSQSYLWEVKPGTKIWHLDCVRIEQGSALVMNRIISNTLRTVSGSLSPKADTHKHTLTSFLP